MRRAGLVLALVLVAGTGSAASFDSIPRPKPRPALAWGAVPAEAVAVRPEARPATVLFRVMNGPRRARPEAAAGRGLDRSLRPVPRPSDLLAKLAAAGLGRQPSAVSTPRRGVVCGDPAIAGEMIAPIVGRIAGCGVARPVRVSAVDGVALSQPVTVDCATARALRSWVSNGIKPAVGRLGGGVASLRVFAHYACRTRNNRKGAKISEHGRGHAVDIGAVTLRNGTSLTVLGGWKDPAQGRVLKQIHRAACGPFGTVLGPGANRFHQDHIHVDTARYRGGAYCR
ncbi:extensin family protein [Rhodovulum sulfidophilum]|nr:extensin family protein [Rhodovulum sulfidophilum]MBL3566935.1 extensin family protein [Rhodovulum sulfidophilum]